MSLLTRPSKAPGYYTVRRDADDSLVTFGQGDGSDNAIPGTSLAYFPEGDLAADAPGLEAQVTRDPETPAERDKRQQIEADVATLQAEASSNPAFAALVRLLGLED